MTSTFNASYSPQGRPFLEVCDALHTLVQAPDIKPNIKAITKCATKICKQTSFKNLSTSDLLDRIQKLNDLTQVDAQIKPSIEKVLKKLQNIQPTPTSTSTPPHIILTLLQQLTQGIIKNPKYNTAPLIAQLTQAIQKLHSIQDLSTLNSIQAQLDLLHIIAPSQDLSLENLLNQYTSAMTSGTTFTHLTSSPITPLQGIPVKEEMIVP